MTAPGTDLVVVRDADALAREAAGWLLARLATVQTEGRAPAVALTGGTIADRMHAAAAEHPRTGPTAYRVDWSRVDLWWGDERYLAADDADRNAVQARRALLDHVPVDPARVHEAPAADSGPADVEAAAAAYAAELREQGPDRFDLVMLGVGPDGHVASLFPGYPQLDVVDAAVVAVHDSPKPPPERVSLTLPVLNRAAEVWFLASGEAKAEAVARALTGADVHEVPAAGVRGRERTVWLLDEAAASRLPR